MNPKGAATGHDGQASYEWKVGMIWRRTHLKLGFEQVPHRLCPGTGRYAF